MNNKDNNDSISKNIKRILMFRAFDKINKIIDREKQQEKSDKIHVVLIIGAVLLALFLTYVVTTLAEKINIIG